MYIDVDGRCPFLQTFRVIHINLMHSYSLQFDLFTQLSQSFQAGAQFIFVALKAEFNRGKG